MTGSFLAPPVWTSEELTHERDKAEDSFRSQRRDEGPARYAATFNEVAPVVADALARAELWGRDLENALLQDDRLWHTLRYFCGPEISEEDFWTLVGKKSRRMPSSVAGDAANVLGELVDPFRLPWLAESREPTTSELQAAILATSTLVAHQRLRTERRGSAARRQEDDVADSLLAAGYTRQPSVERRTIRLIDDLPRGVFAREQKIADAKCDVPVRLLDGRLLAIECKVSNGPKNSWKRLLREVGGKADKWRMSFGSHFITGAVIAGVYDLKCLERAQQEHQVTLFWQHDLTKLADSVASAVQ